MNDSIIKGLESAKPKGWFELSVEGKPPFLVDSETIFRHSLRVGEVLSESEFRQVKNESDIAWLKGIGMQALSRRMISERDLRRRLTEERRPKYIREEVIAQFKRYGLLDDSKYSANYVRSQLARGPRSKLYLKQKLRERGIREEIAREAIDAEYEGFDELGAVKEMAARKYKSVKFLPPQKAKMRVINFLRSRGFPWETIRKAIEGLFTPDDTGDTGET